MCAPLELQVFCMTLQSVHPSNASQSVNAVEITLDCTLDCTNQCALAISLTSLGCLPEAWSLAREMRGWMSVQGHASSRD